MEDKKCNVISAINQFDASYWNRNTKPKKPDGIYGIAAYKSYIDNSYKTKRPNFNSGLW
jgi:hypothetical protein